MPFDFNAQQSDRADRSDLGTSRHLGLVCQVIDNFGDIGVVYRLTRHLRQILDAHWRISLVVDNLEAFTALCPALDPTLGLQNLALGQSVRVIRSDQPEAKNLEADWLIVAFNCQLPPDLLGSLNGYAAKQGRKTILFNLDYLSSEDWVASVHRLPSLVQGEHLAKYFFMPGFTKGSGGLTLDQHFMQAMQHARQDPRRFRQELWSRLARQTAIDDQEIHAIQDCSHFLLVFSYEYDYQPLALALAKLRSQGQRWGVLVAAGRSSRSLLAAWAQTAKGEPREPPAPLLALPMLDQQLFDQLILASDCLIVRGEESLSRALIAGSPFLWQAYPQAEEHQLVKVQAVLTALRANFAEAQQFLTWHELLLDFNTKFATPSNEQKPLVLSQEQWETFLNLSHYPNSFQKISKNVQQEGDLGQNLLTFFSECCMMQAQNFLNVGDQT